MSSCHLVVLRSSSPSEGPNESRLESHPPLAPIRSGLPRQEYKTTRLKARWSVPFLLVKNSEGWQAPLTLRWPPGLGNCEVPCGRLNTKPADWSKSRSAIGDETAAVGLKLRSRSFRPPQRFHRHPSGLDQSSGHENRATRGSRKPGEPHVDSTKMLRIVIEL